MYRTVVGRNVWSRMTSPASACTSKQLQWGFMHGGCVGGNKCSSPLSAPLCGHLGSKGTQEGQSRLEVNLLWTPHNLASVGALRHPHPAHAQPRRGFRHSVSIGSNKGLTPYTLHPAPHTLTLHPTPFTLHPAPCTLHPTPYTLQGYLAHKKTPALGPCSRTMPRDLR